MFVVGKKESIKGVYIEIMSMKSRSAFTDSVPAPPSEMDENRPTLLIQQNPMARNKKAGLGWWYYLTAPKEAADTASLAERERSRRGRLISAVMFFALIMFMLGFLIGVFGPNHFIAFAVLFPIFMIFIASLFNRSGRTGIAGFIIPLGLNLALIAVTLSSPLTPSSIQLYDLLVFVEVFAVSLLPPNGWVLSGFVLFNLIFIQADITLQPHTALFAAMIATDNVTVRMRPVVIHVVLASVMWLWVRSANNAILRADRAEVIANLEHVVAEQERAVAQQKVLLDQGIQDIVDTHMRVANGDLSSRVPLSSGSVLWPVAGPLNNLLARFQRMNQEVAEAHQAMYEFQRVREALAQVLYRVRMARIGRRPGPFTRTGTMVDPLIENLDPLLQVHNSSEEGK